MTDLYLDSIEATPPWYRRTRPRVAMAGGVTIVLALTGIGINSASGTESDPQEAVAEAAANLKELPTSVTITGGEANPGEVTLTQTDQGVQVSLQSDQLGGTIEAALIGETLFLRMDSSQLAGFRGNPMLALAMTQYPAIGALLGGQWVSLDVSEDSKVLAALRDAQGSEVGDTDTLRAAGDELKASLAAAKDDVRQPLIDALKDNATATAVDDSTGPEGSDHFTVTVDANQVKQDLTPVLQDAFEQVLQAIDTFVAEVGDQVSDGTDRWQTYRGKLVDDFNKALAKQAETNPAVDVWIADGEFTQISTPKATLTFDSDPTLEAPKTAVSLDDDLINALPLIEQFGSGLVPQGLLKGQLQGLGA